MWWPRYAPHRTAPRRGPERPRARRGPERGQRRDAQKVDEGPKEPDGPAPEFIDKEVEDEARDLLADYGIDVRGAKKQKRIKSKTGATNEEEDDDIEDDAGASLPLPRVVAPRCSASEEKNNGK